MPDPEAVVTIGQRSGGMEGGRNRPSRGSGRSNTGGSSLPGGEAESRALLVSHPDGPESISRAGGTVSTVKERKAGLGSVLPAESVALTSKVWGPSVSAARVLGLKQGEKGSVPTRHSKVAPASEENSKLGVASPVGPLGPESIVVSGAVVSTVKVLVAGVASWFPAASSALKVAVWGPSERPVKVLGDEQSAKGSESIRHWIFAVSEAGVPEKVKVAWLVVMVPVGPESIVVSGAVVSTVKVLVAGVASWFPAASSALKVAVWGPSERPVKVLGDEQSAKGSESIRHWIFAVSEAGVPEKVKVAWLVVMVPVGPESIWVSGGWYSR